MTLTPDINLTDAIRDKQLFGKVYAPASFWTWAVLAKIIDGLPLTEPRERELFEQCCGFPYNQFNRRRAQRLLCLAGRRAGKDRFFIVLLRCGERRCLPTGGGIFRPARAR
jgi:hypothetical protein